MTRKKCGAQSISIICCTDNNGDRHLLTDQSNAAIQQSRIRRMQTNSGPSFAVHFIFLATFLQPAHIQWPFGPGEFMSSIYILFRLVFIVKPY